MVDSPYQRLTAMVFVFASVLLFGGWACGQPPAVVRITIDVGTSLSIGSGTYITHAGQQCILTCAHLFDDGDGAISVKFPDGRLVPGRLVAADQAWDIAAIAIADPGVTPVEIASQYPNPGESLYSSGYDGRTGSYRVNSGRALGYVRAPGTPSIDTLELTGYGRDGDSGGPVLNERGELVAVLWGTDGRSVMGTVCGRIRKLLGKLSGRVPPLSTGFG